MNRRPRVLLLTPFPPFPPTNGGLLRILSLVERLRARWEFSLLTFARTTGERRFQHHAAALALRRVFKEVHLVDKETTDRAPKRPGWPSIAQEWWSPEMAARLEALCGSGAADIVHIEFLQLAAYAAHSKGVPTVLTEHDLSHLSLFKSYFREWTGWKRWSQVGEWLRTRRFHREACARFDRLVALTPEDAARLERSAPSRKIRLIRTCVDLERFAFKPGGERPVDFATVGHYLHFPNEDAAVWFAREVLPIAASLRPGVRFAVVGSDPTPAVQALAGDRVEVTGTVPDIRAQLDRAKVFVAPVRLGFGVKGKVLEAFARGVPVVATTVVQRGIPEARPGEHLLTADGPAEFARAAVRLLEDGALRRRLVSAGRALVERHYDWERSCSALDGLYRELRGLGPAAGDASVPSRERELSRKNA